MNQENINNTRYFSQLYSSPFQGLSTRDHSSYWVTGVRRQKSLNPQPCSLGMTWSCFLGEIWSNSSFIAEILDSDVIQLSGFFSSLVTLREELLLLQSRRSSHTKYTFIIFQKMHSFDPFPFAADRNYLFEWNHPVFVGSYSRITKRHSQAHLFHTVTWKMAISLGLRCRIFQVSWQCCLFYHVIRF